MSALLCHWPRGNQTTTGQKQQIQFQYQQRPWKPMWTSGASEMSEVCAIHSWYVDSVAYLFWPAVLKDGSPSRHRLYTVCEHCIHSLCVSVYVCEHKDRIGSSQHHNECLSNSSTPHIPDMPLILATGIKTTDCKPTNIKTSQGFIPSQCCTSSLQ